MATVTCPMDDCELTFTTAGELAGHLVEDHNMGASVALGHARQLIGRSDVEPRQQRRPASAAPRSTPPITEDPPMPKVDKRPKTYRCRICKKPGHNARVCSQKPAAAPKPARDRRTTRAKTGPEIARAALIRISAPPAAVSSEIAGLARERARSLVTQKLAEELVHAEAYVDELKRVQGLA